ncbi:MAG: malto-oligosyltrehalose trehalohydrolase [Hyphomicrobiales bacterium]|nr:malto-oligosyltrehalose trehalohydrolase [Hyphomicrobiales bacterium]
MTDHVSKWTHGPLFEPGGVRFRLWAPREERVSLALEGRASAISMERCGGGFFEAFVDGTGAGALYRFELADGRRVPDPASRFQPADVHGPSEIIDHEAYRWGEDWPGRDWDDVVLYELHLGAFTPEGTFAAATGKIAHLAELGVTALEIMPVGDFRGRWGWGYDGVFLYAPDATYGRPDDFKGFVAAAHRLGIAVLLDVVYNHFGPEGNYLPLYAPDFFTGRHRTPWGEAINYDGLDARPVRDFVAENAEYWIEAFHLDGLRLDAAHAIKDESRPDIVDEIAERLRSRFSRPIHLILENEDNEPERLIRCGRKPRLYDAQWNDDVHHVLHVAATGEQSGYYGDYGSTRILGRALAEGFAFQGEIMRHRGAARGAPCAFLPPGAFVAFIQNHDQIGNRAFGERLDALALPEAIRALMSVYLLLPQTPMLFMGEEWGAEQPFPFFCDFDGELAEAVRNGRREEFARFPEFADPARAAQIPDPTAKATFLSAKLDWRGVDPERLGFTREALAARRKHVRPLLPEIGRAGDFVVRGEQAVSVAWAAGARRLILDANLSPARVAFPPAGRVFWRCGEADGEFGPWSVRWTVSP